KLISAAKFNRLSTRCKSNTLIASDGPGHLFAFNYGTDFMMKKSLCCALLLTASFSISVIRNSPRRFPLQEWRRAVGFDMVGHRMMAFFVLIAMIFVALSG
ncbi:TPA: hypothetical protein ACJEWW_005695, partial [Klebsiella pneumoniae]